MSAGLVKEGSIEHVQQVDNQTCVAACLAMVLGTGIDYVLKYVGAPCNMQWAARFLTFHRIHCIEVLDRELEYGYCYLISVPSLNRPGLLHCVVLDLRNEKACILYDPQMGRARHADIHDFQEGRIGWASPVRLIDCSEIVERPQYVPAL